MALQSNKPLNRRSDIPR